MKRSKKILAIALAICMTLAMQPMAALAITSEITGAAGDASTTGGAIIVNDENGGSDAAGDVIDDAVNAENGDGDNVMGLEEVPEEPQETEPVAIVGIDPYETFEEAWGAVTNGTGKTLTLQQDATWNIGEGMAIGNVTTIDLNGQTLDITGVGAGCITVTNGGNLMIRNGSITANGVEALTDPVFQVEANSSIQLSGVDFSTDGTALFPKGDAAKVEIVNGSYISASGYGVSTNAAVADNYDVKIDLQDSTISGNVAVMINVPGTLHVDNCRMMGLLQSVIVRGGTADIENSNIIHRHPTDWDEETAQYMAEYFLNRNWQSGNNIAAGALVLGNRGNKAYEYPTDVTLVNCDISVEGEYAKYFSDIYVWANESEGNGVTLTMERCSVDEDKIVYGNDGKNITVAEDVGIDAAYIRGGESYADLASAVEAAQDGDEVVLMRNVKLESYLIIRKDITLDLGGYTITGSGAYTLIASCAGTPGKEGFTTHSVHITNGTVKNTNAKGIAIYAQAASVDLNGMTVTSNGDGMLIGAGMQGYFGKAVVRSSTVKGGINGQISGSANGIVIYGADMDENDSNKWTAEESSLELYEGVDVSGACYGVTGNGRGDHTSIKLQNNATVSGGIVGLYHPQQGELCLIGNPEVRGPVGLQICGGNMQLDGGIIVSTQTEDMSEPYKNLAEDDGTVQDGAALSVLSRKAYGDVTVKITNGVFKTANRNNPVIGRYGFEKVDGEWTTVDPEPTNVRVEISGGTYDNEINHDYLAFGYEVVEYPAENVYKVEASYAANFAAMIKRGDIDMPYSTLEEAVADAQPGEGVILLKNVTLAGQLVIDKDMTLNLGDNTIDGGSYNVMTKANVVVKADKGGISTKAAYAIANGQAGTTLTVEGGNYSATTIAVYANSGETTIKGGHMTAAYGARANANATLNVEDGTFDGTFAILTTGADSKANISGGVMNGTVKATKGAAVNMTAGTIVSPAIGIQADGNSLVDISGGSVETTGAGNKNCAIQINGSTLKLSGDAEVKAMAEEGGTGVSLFRSVDNSYGAVLEMTGGSITATGMALNGNNQLSAGTKADISGGSITSEGYAAIYWPMSGDLTVSGDANIQGATGIEAKLGNIKVSGGTITGTGEYKEDAPMNGGSSPEGSALLLSAQMYDSADGNSDQKVEITGGALVSEQGNAITVYNTLKKETGSSTEIRGGKFEAGAGREAIYVATAQEGTAQNNTSVTLYGGAYDTDEEQHCAVGYCSSRKTESDPYIVGKHAMGEQVLAQTPTCTEDGNVAYYHCDNCGKNYVDAEGTTILNEIVVEKTGHAATFHEAVPATCLAEGTLEYWHCENCGKDFSDEDCTVEMTTVVDPKKEHEAEHHEAAAATCTEDGNIEYWQCATCDKYFMDEACENEITEEATVIAATGHEAEHYEAAAATCTEDGKIEYWQCASCGKYFIDEACETEIAEEQTVIAAAGHETEHHEAAAATCTEDGKIEYWQCASCGKYFSDEACETEITEEQTVIAAAGHHMVVMHDENGHWTACDHENCTERTESTPHVWVEGTPANGQRIDTCELEGCGQTHTVTVGGGGNGGGGGGSIGGGGGGAITPEPDEEVEIVDPDVPLAQPFLFTDVMENDWFYGAVKHVNDEGLMSGLTTTIFGPGVSTTRAMIATIIHKMEGAPEPGDAYGFTDVNTGRYYADAVNWAANANILSGYDATTYAPEQNVTREQLVSILFRYANMKKADTTARGDVSKFADQDQISNYAKEAMEWAVGVGLVSGRSETILAPKGQTTRAELAQILMNFQSLMEKQEEE